MTQPSSIVQHSPAMARAGAKKLIVCLDGTNNEIGMSRTTNVGKTFEMLSLTQPARQLAYYDPGVGTLPAPTARGKVGRAASRAAELAFGWGIRANVAQAYTWLMQHYQFRDEIYIFGFSRGAYTARALVGMLNRPGLLRPGSENLVDYAVSEYAINGEVNQQRKERINEFADAFCWGTANDQLSPNWQDPNPDFHWGWHAVPISYLGIWDTVEAAGIGPLGNLKWPFTHELPNVRRLRHAVSMDEHRGPYREYLVDQHDGVEEVWFAGVHSDVGGTFPEYELAKISLKWVIDGVVRDLILREADSYTKWCTVTEADALGTIHTMAPVWRAAGTHHRQIPPGAVLHDAVRKRMQTQSAHYAPRLPDGISYTPADEWIDLVPSTELTIAPQQ